MSESVRPASQPSAKDWLPYLAVIAVFLALIGVGYFGFRTFVTTDARAFSWVHQLGDQHWAEPEKFRWGDALTESLRNLARRYEGSSFTNTRGSGLYRS